MCGISKECCHSPLLKIVEQCKRRMNFLFVMRLNLKQFWSILSFYLPSFPTTAWYIDFLLASLIVFTLCGMSKLHFAYTLINFSFPCVYTENFEKQDWQKHVNLQIYLYSIHRKGYKKTGFKLNFMLLFLANVATPDSKEIKLAINTQLNSFFGVK